MGPALQRILFDKEHVRLRSLLLRVVFQSSLPSLLQLRRASKLLYRLCTLYLLLQIKNCRPRTVQPEADSLAACYAPPKLEGGSYLVVLSRSPRRH